QQQQQQQHHHHHVDGQADHCRLVGTNKHQQALPTPEGQQARGRATSSEPTPARGLRGAAPTAIRRRRRGGGNHQQIPLRTLHSLLDRGGLRPPAADVRHTGQDRSLLQLQCVLNTRCGGVNT
ncbi:unnamed protein product, partial [Ectocarpus sp. 8 AP-2014]